MKKKKISAKNGKNKAPPKTKKRANKNVKTFLRSEKGKISKRSAAKLGMGVLAAGLGLSGLMKASGAGACWDSVGTTYYGTTY
jgi:hypothetical protein